jgi:[methyl-Co(III) methanol-specific corrinoid protein]:coenzyme M methyltransferase
VGGRAAVIGKVMGPWTMSYHMAGTQNFLLWALTDPCKVRGFLERLKEVTVLFAKAQFQAGADIVVLADHATRNLVGPYHYEQYLLPIHQEITAQVGGPVILHVCGNCSDRLELFARSGVDAYHFEWQVDSREAVRRIGDKISLAGNVNNPQALLQGTPEDVYKQARYAIEAGVHLIGPECAIPLSTPLANLRAIVEAARAGY